MIKAIIDIVSAIRALIALFRLFNEWSYQTKVEEANRRNKERAKAIDDSKKAQSDDEIWKSQEKIVKNKP